MAGRHQPRRRTVVPPAYVGFALQHLDDDGGRYPDFHCFGHCLRPFVPTLPLLRQNLFQTAITLPLCIPAFVSCFTWISLTFRVEGFWGTVMIMSLSSFPLAYLPVEAALKRISLSYEEVSLSLGKSRLQTFFPPSSPAQTRHRQQRVTDCPAYAGRIWRGIHFELPHFTTAIFQEYEMSYNNNTAALLSAVLMAVCGIVVFGESIFRGKAKIYHSGKGVARPIPSKPSNCPVRLARLFFKQLVDFGHYYPLWRIDTLDDGRHFRHIRARIRI